MRTHKIKEADPYRFRNFVDELVRKHDGIWKLKKDSKLMQWIGKFMDKFVFRNHSTSFVDRYSTTFPGIIWFSFEPGDFDKVPIIKQIAIVIHECTHLDQFKSEKLRSLYYLLNNKYRILFEAQAFATNMETYIRLTGRIPMISNYMDSLSKYLTFPSNEDYDYMRRLFQSHRKGVISAVENGYYYSPIVEEAFDLLKKYEIIEEI